jgi:hypothetical protein
VGIEKADLSADEMAGWSNQRNATDHLLCLYGLAYNLLFKDEQLSYRIPHREMMITCVLSV